MSHEFEYFKMCHPYIADKVVGFKDIGYGEYLVECDDGSRILFNMTDGSFRSLPRDPDNLSKEEYSKEFGRRLIRILERKHISQHELSNRTGIAQYLISDYVNGRRLPGTYNLYKISRVLNCAMDEFDCV